VHGTEAAQVQEARYLANKLYFVSRYAVPIVDADKLENTKLPEFCAAANLILIGHKQDNKLVSDHQCAFPYIRLHDHNRGFSLNGLVYSGDAVGLMALGRMPNGHLAMLLHGTDDIGLSRAVARVPASAFVDNADFMVIGPDAGWEGLGGVLAAGYLDQLWRPSVRGSWAEPQHAVKKWHGVGYETSADTHCVRQRHLLELSDAEVERFSRSGSQRATTTLMPVFAWTGLILSLMGY